jgi:hypothetical protein
VHAQTRCPSQLDRRNFSRDSIPVNVPLVQGVQVELDWESSTARSELAPSNAALNKITR